MFLQTSKEEIINTINSTVSHSYEWAENKCNLMLEAEMEASEFDLFH
ncbi:hypothetical protein [Clostridium frigidicarnis]|nr:hypothetical protein [Clostridium frigidicarnis]